MIYEDMSAVERSRVRAEMRATATMLEKFSDLYPYGPDNWTPRRLRYEADYLEKHDGIEA